MTVNLVSLGCPKNLVDSEKILGALGASGMTISAFPKDSDIIIINTCGFIKPALDETEDEIKKALQITKGSHKKLYVFGCAVNRKFSELKAKYPGVSEWFRLEDRSKLLHAISATARHINARLATTRGFAYLKIADGCSNHCAYCTIPSIKGEYHSFVFDDIIKEARELAKLGIREIILIAQDTTRYGIDLYGKSMLTALIKELSKIPQIKWIRIMYAHPKSLSEEVINEIESNHKVCKYIDLPIQHINNRILHLMNRGVKRKRIEDIIKRLKNIKEISIRTTIIIGFPTESDDEFKELFEFVKEINFDWLGIFPYYCEPETEAARLKQVPISVIEERYNKIIRLQRRLMKRRHANQIGNIYKTLIHSRDGYYRGHTEFSAPEVDAEILSNTKDMKIGNFYKLRITRARGCNLYADSTDDTE